MLASVQSRCHTGITPFQQPACRVVRRHLALQRQTVCSAQRPQLDQAESAVRRFAMPLTAAVAAALIISAGAPDEALAARSGGRVGGSSFRSARPAPAPRAPSGGGGGQSGPTIRNYNYHSYSPPPLYGGYGPGYGYGGGGITLMPSFGVPLIGGGSFFTVVIGLFALSAVLSVARSLSNRGRRDDYDDFN